ncbi:MAG TPA: hypothetical protein V6D05_14635 [Stenomitos sp.]
MKRATWILAGLTVLAAGCSTTAPTSNQTAPAQPTPQLAPDRSAMADGGAAPSELQLPSRLTQAEGDRLLVDLPADKLKGGLQMNQDGRTVQQWWRYRYYRYGGYYYPYYNYGSYYYPYYSYSYPYYTYPYYSYYGSYYYPYYSRYRYRRW